MPDRPAAHVVVGGISSLFDVDNCLLIVVATASQRRRRRMDPSAGMLSRTGA